CTKLLNKFKADEIEEAKREGEVNFRRSFVTITKDVPHPFYISTHDKQIDRVRASIMTHHMYYESALTSLIADTFVKARDEGREAIFLDVGANIEPKPIHLAQYGIMGDAYARGILGIKNPRVALMNVGGEDGKGTSEMKHARDMLRSAENLNFIGYVEGRGVFDGDADVVITDGVVGNVMIKLAEGLSKGLFQAIAAQVLETDPELAVRLEPVVKAIYAKHDYHEYGGAPLLGVNGTCLISHGSSVSRTMMNAILRARQFVLCGLNDSINARLETIQEPTA
ncbi:MAG: phosphate acyltransferase, partial [Planctomycetota bacterium]